MLEVRRVLGVRRVRAVLLVLAVAVVAGTTAVAESRTIGGEVVDVRCFEKAADNAGPAHTDCALSCARRGATLGIRTAHGVFTITGEYTTGMNRRLMAFVGRTVEAQGDILERNGYRTIRIRDIKLKPAA